MPLDPVNAAASSASASALASVGRRTAALVVLCFVQFMLVLNDTAVSVALASIRSDLGLDTAGLAWVANAYFISFGGLLLLGGRMADLLGRRRVFGWGVALFGAASLVCAIASEPWQLIAGRFGQGVGAAIASPAALSLITRMFPGPAERGRALGGWGALAGLGGTVGLVIAGALTGLASWRWIFLINLPVAIIALVLLPRLVPESRALGRGRRLDVAGTVLGTGAIVALVYGLLQTAESGWAHPGTLLPLTLAIALGAAFAIVETRVADPLIPASFLADRARLIANGATLLVSASLFAMAFLLMLHLQTGLNYPPLTAGLAYLPYGAGILIGVWLSSRAVAAIGLRWTLVGSLLITAAGTALLAAIEPGDSYAFGILPGFIVTSVGCGLALPALAAGALAGTNDTDAGVGSAVFTSMQQVGGAIGLATLVTFAAWRTDAAVLGGADPARASTVAFALAMLFAAALLAVAAILVIFLRSSPRTSRG